MSFALAVRATPWAPNTSRPGRLAVPWLPPNHMRRIHYHHRVKRLLRRGLGLLLMLLALALLGAKLWLEHDGPYLEALPPYPYCSEAQAALHDGNVPDAIELAEAGGCHEQLTAAQARWNELSAVFQRCLDGVWTGRAADGAGLTCAVASDLVVFGDVRDLTRQGISWARGEATDPVLIALSAAGIALTFAPQVGAGTSILKGARRAGALTEGLARSAVKLVQERAWRPLGSLLTDAGRISTKLGPAKATKALAYADDATDLARIAQFAEAAPNALLGLKWGGKAIVRLGDDALYKEALRRGPDGVRLALTRGTKALMTQQPLLVFVAKSVYKNPEAIAAFLAALVGWLIAWFSWQTSLVIAAVLFIVGRLLFRHGPKRGRLRYRSA